MEIVYSEHLKVRLRIREIPYELPKNIFINAKEHYFDIKTDNFIAVMEVEFKNRKRVMMVSYEYEKKERINLITIHPLKENQRRNRLKSGRWIKK